MSLNVLTAGEGPALLLLHGFTGTARTWAGHLERWAATHRVIAPDLLGHGGSAAPADPSAYALERQAAGLWHLLSVLGAVPATVLGYSMGARLALVLALHHPASVDRLVLESPSAGIAAAAARQARAEADGRLADAIERDGVAAFVDGWGSQPLFASHAALPGKVREAQRRERRRHTSTGLAGSLRGAGQGVMTPLHDRLAQVTVPTLVIAGSLDATGLERAREVTEAIAGARLEVVPDAGHTAHLEAPAVFARLVDAFIRTSQPTH